MTKRISPHEIGSSGTADDTSFLRGDGAWVNITQVLLLDVGDPVPGDTPIGTIIMRKA